MERALVGKTRWRAGWASLAVFLCLVGTLVACQVPVFRFALERWPADNFRLLVTSEGALGEGLKKDLDVLQKELEGEPRPMNVELEVIDLPALSEAQRISIPGLEHAGSEPTMILLPPASWKVEEPAWVGAASVENLARLLDSPARQRCVEHLVAGESVVWLLVESGDAEKDAQTTELLKEGLTRATKGLKIPDGVVRREDLANREFENLDLDDVLRSDIPLRISFAIEPVSRDDPDEALFLSILASPEDLRSGEPLIVPVFGRGRTPSALPASQLTLELIYSACEYLCGACSCQVKEGNPGYDLLFKASWDALLNSTIITSESAVVQQALDVVTFDPATKSAARPAGRQKKGPNAVVVLLLAVAAIAALFWTTPGKTRTSH